MVSFIVNRLQLEFYDKTIVILNKIVKVFVAIVFSK